MLTSTFYVNTVLCKKFSPTCFSLIVNCLSVYHLFDKDVDVKHEMHHRKFSPLQLKNVCLDVCKLLDYISLVPKTDSDIDILYLTAHAVKERQIRFHKNYYISYDWDKIFQSKTPTVPHIVVHKQYDFTFLTSKELKA